MSAIASRQILLALFDGLSLPIRSRELRAIPDVRLAVALEDSSGLIVEGML
jgi:hypothetical protein